MLTVNIESLSSSPKIFHTQVPPKLRESARFSVEEQGYPELVYPNPRGLALFAHA